MYRFYLGLTALNLIFVFKLLNWIIKEYLHCNHEIIVAMLDFNRWDFPYIGVHRVSNLCVQPLVSHVNLWNIKMTFRQYYVYFMLLKRKHLFLPVTRKITYSVKWVCVHCTSKYDLCLLYLVNLCLTFVFPCYGFII